MRSLFCLVAASLLAHFEALAQVPSSANDIAAAPLWQGLTYGMSPEAVSEKLLLIPGIQEVKMKLRKGKSPTFKIKYTESGVTVGDMMARVVPIFDGEHLAEVNLITDECFSRTKDQMGTIAEVLKAKYGNMVREKAVDKDGSVEDRFAYWNDQTRVRVAFRFYNRASDGVSSYSGSGIGGALSELGAALAKDSALKECPADQGGKAESIVNYSAQSVFQAEQAAMGAKNEETRRKAAEGL